MDKRIGIKEAAEILGVSTSTLRRWEKEGRITSYRTQSGGRGAGHRRYDKDKVLELAGRLRPRTDRVTVGYARVSSSDQREDMVRQREMLLAYCAAHGWSCEIVEDLGSGLNYNRRGFTGLIRRIINNEIERVVIVHRDRLVRFGHELMEQIFEQKEVSLEIIDKTEVDLTREEEFVQDVIAIITVFSAKLYGARSRKHKQIAAILQDNDQS